MNIKNSEEYERLRRCITHDPYIGYVVTGAVFCALLAIATYFIAPKNCSQFLTWEFAQASYLSDKVKYKSLDRNADGIACNSRM